MSEESLTGEVTRWYSLRVISGKEKKIKERIELEITRNKWSEFIPQILVPSEKVYKIRKGKKVIEANRMLGKVDESQEVSEAMIEPYIIGETIKVVDGPFNEFVGDVLEVNEEKKKLKVIVKIFGRGTEVELNFMQVEKT